MSLTEHPTGPRAAHAADGPTAQRHDEHRADEAGFRTRKRPRRRDRGYSLIEIVIAISLMGMVIIPVLAAVKAGIQVSSVARSAAKAETAIVNAADRINRADLSCDYTLFAEASVQVEKWPPSAATVTQKWYSHQLKDWVDEGPGGDGCPYANVTEDLVQLVTVTIKVPNSDIERTIQVVKSNV